MTIYGPDISSYQHGVDVTELTDPFVILKCTEGTGYADPDYRRWLTQARSANKLTVAYHFVRSDSSAAGQAAWLAGHIVDVSVPVMLDVETTGSSVPRLPLVLAVADAMRAAGLNVRLVYLPRWFWEQIGSPSLTPLTARGIGVVSSAYPVRGPVAPVPGYQASGGDHGPGWAPYGGVTPVLWQFTDAGVEQQRLDFNAYRGTIDQLAAMLGGGVTVQGGTTVGTYTISAGWQNDYPDVAGQLQQHMPVGTVVDETKAAAYAMVRSFVAAERAAVIEAKLDRLLAAAPPAVDVAAIAAAVVAGIGDHLAVGVDAQAVAVAVQAQLAQALSVHGVA